MAAQPGVIVKKGDAADQAGLASLLIGHDAVISAVRFADSDPRVLLGAVKAAGVPRYLVVGGAGSLEIAPESGWSIRRTSRPSTRRKR